MASSPYDNLLENSKTGNFSKISEFLQKNNFSEKEIDEAFRTLLTNYKKEKERYYASFKSFIKYTNINYQNPDHENTTILIETINLGLFYPCEKLIKYFKYLEGDSKLNINLTDDQGDTILFKIINSKLFKSEDNRYELYKELITENPDIQHTNKQGHTLLSLAVLNGHYFIAEELLKMQFELKQVVKSNGDNLIHCAVRSGNVLCLNLVKQFLSDDHLSDKNLEGKTPEGLACQLKNEDMIQFLTKNQKLYQKELLDEFTKRNFIKILYQLSSDSFNSDKKDLSLLWNNLLNEYMIEYNRINMTQSERKSISMSFYNKVVSFFKNNEEKFNYDQPIICLNYMMLKYKLGNITEVESLFNTFEEKFLEKDQTEQKLFFFWICFVNIQLILLGEYINSHKISKSNEILTKLENFLTINQKSEQNVEKNSYLSSIITYLNSNETINQTNDVDQIIFLYKCYKLSNEGNIDKAFSELKEYKAKYIKDKDTEKFLPFQKTLNKLKKFLKIKLLYQKGDYDKFIKHLTPLQETIAKDQENEYNRIFYYNSIGIMSLKKSQFKYAEFCFKKCEQIIKSQKKKEFIIQNIAGFMPCIWYNIGLCYFYNKKYEKSLKIFTYCKLFKNCKDNPCLYYRIGICLLDKELQSLKRDSISNSINDLVQTIEFPDSPSSVRCRFLLRTRDENVCSNENIVEAMNNFKEAIFIFKEEASKNKSPQSYLIEIFNSSYINLLFSLTILENWNDVLFFGKDYQKSPYFSKNNNFIVNNYLIQAYLNLGSVDQALDLLSKELTNITLPNYIMKMNDTFYSNIIHVDYLNVNCRIAIYVNFLKINLMKRNFEGFEGGMKTLIGLLKKISNKKKEDDNVELPMYIISILLYYFLLNNKIEEACLLVKTRKIPTMFK